MADRLDVVTPERQVVELEHPHRGVVDQLQASLRIDHDDAFDHAGQDRFHPRAVARLLGELPSDDLHRVVERPRHGAEFVVAVVEPRRREIAAAIPVGDLGNGTDPVAHSRREHPADDDRSGQRHAKCRHRRGENAPKLLLDAGQRQRDPHERHGGMNDRRRDVEHVDVDRVAVTPGFAEPSIARLDNLGPRAVVFHERDGRWRFGRVAQDAAVARDERDARVEQLRRGDRLRRRIRGCGRRSRRPPRRARRREPEGPPPASLRRRASARSARRSAAPSSSRSERRQLPARSRPPASPPRRVWSGRSRSVYRRCN